MGSSKAIGAVLIVISLLVGYLGFNKISDNTKEMDVLGLQIEASNASGKQQGYLYAGVAVLLFAGGIYSINRSKS